MLEIIQKHFPGLEMINGDRLFDENKSLRKAEKEKVDKKLRKLKKIMQQI